MKRKYLYLTLTTAPIYFKPDGGTAKIYKPRPLIFPIPYYTSYITAIKARSRVSRLPTCQNYKGGQIDTQIESNNDDRFHSPPR